MTLADLDSAAAIVLAWLLTYLIHSTILLSAAAFAARCMADHHAWLDVMWKTAVVAPIVTASLNLGAIALPIGSQWTVPSVEPAAITTSAVPESTAAPTSEQPAPASATARPARRRIDSAPPAPLPGWPAIAVAAWLTVAMISVVWYAVRLRRVYRALRSGAPASHDLVEAVDGLRRDAGLRPIRLTTSALCPVPLALAGQQIVVPRRFVGELDAEQQRAALAHEVAHVARRDPEWRIAIEILERALVVQPLNRLARVRLSDAAEFLCDEWAVQHTATPLALARCLSVVGSWWSPAEELPAGVSAMARSDSAMVRRVTRILNEPVHRSSRPRLPWLAVPVALIALAAPRVTATAVLPRWIGDRPPFSPSATSGPVPTTPNGENGGLAPTHQSQRDWTPAEIAAVRARVQDYRAGGSLDERWRRAMADAATRRLTDFWMVYTFTTPTHDRELILSDSKDGGGLVVADGQVITDGPPLAAILDQGAVPLEGGRIAILMHHRGARADAMDRGAYLSPAFGFDFGRAPIFWLGDAAEAESFARVQALFGQARQEPIQVLLIELASLHSDSNAVIPFLTGLVDPKWPPQIREEAAEGFEHHHDPRSVEVLLRVARTDPESGVRSEAAETIGEVQTPQSIPALTELVHKSDDSEVRREAAEAFAEQPAAQAVPALQSIISAIEDEEVVNEAIEALGDLAEPSALALLVEIANTHAMPLAQHEAVETIGDLDDPRVVDTLTKIAWEHRDVAIQKEAVETLGDRNDDADASAAVERIVREHPGEETQVEAIETLAEMSAAAIPSQVLALVESGRSAHIRRAAIEAIADELDKVTDVRTLDTAERVFERAIYSDPDTSVRMEALDALDELPGDRARRALQKIIDGHPDARVRREAAEHLRKD